MSWHLAVVSKDRNLVKEKTQDTPYMPQQIKDFICEAVDALAPDNDVANAVKVETNGHHDAYQASATVSVMHIKFLE